MAKTLSINQINQSTGAKRTISNMAKAMRLDAEWLHTLLSLHWNYDKKGREAMDWVELEIDDALQSAYEKVLSVFRLPETNLVSRETLFMCLPAKRLSVWAQHQTNRPPSRNRQH